MKAKLSNLIDLKDTKLYYPYSSGFKALNFTIVLNHETGERINYYKNELHFSLFPHLYSGKKKIWAKTNLLPANVDNKFIIKKLFEAKVIYD